jgi:hypothetical protein
VPAHGKSSALFQCGQVAESADVRLPEVYALLAGTARAATRAHLDDQARARLLAVIIDGLAPRERPGPAVTS